MSKAFCLLNHQLTQNQITELKEEFGAEEIIYPSEELSKMWSQIPATKQLDINIIDTILKWHSLAQENDILIIQGEYGSTFMIVDYALKHNLVPLYAVTKRVAAEQRNDEIVSRQYIFEHVCFRKYEYFNDKKKSKKISESCQFFEI